MTQKAGMDALNRARVEFKHHGTMPSRTDIETFRANALSFLNENTQLVFSIDFDTISLVEVIGYASCRATLKEASDFVAQGDFKQSLEKSALAFLKLIDEYEDTKRTKFGRSPFFFGESLAFLNSSHIGLDRRDTSVRGLAEFVDKTTDSIESIRDALKIVALGLDFTKYVKFNLLTPHMHSRPNGDYTPYWTSSARTPTEEDSHFAIDFVVDCAVKLQNSDWTA
jgi:hypothetical protein